jgi:hypothetical protein
MPVFVQTLQNVFRFRAVQKLLSVYPKPSDLPMLTVGDLFKARDISGLHFDCLHHKMRARAQGDPRRIASISTIRHVRRWREVSVMSSHPCLLLPSAARMSRRCGQRLPTTLVRIAHDSGDQSPTARPVTKPAPADRSVSAHRPQQTATADDAATARRIRFRRWLGMSVDPALTACVSATLISHERITGGSQGGTVWVMCTNKSQAERIK